jgi:hypothetical protein
MTEQPTSIIPQAEQPESAGKQEAKTPFEQFLEHQKRAVEETGKALEALFPPGFREHSEQARKEFIKGMKVLVDAAVVELEKASKEVDRAIKQARQGKPSAPNADSAGSERPSSTGKTKVKVQVD